MHYKRGYAVGAVDSEFLVIKFRLMIDESHEVQVGIHEFLNVVGYGQAQFMICN